MASENSGMSNLSFANRAMAKVFKGKRHCGNCKNFDLPRGQALFVQISPKFAHGVAQHVSADKFMRKLERFPILNEDGTPKLDDHGNPTFDNRELIPAGDTGARWTDYGACEKLDTLVWSKYTCPEWR